MMAGKLPTLAELDRFGTSRDAEDSVGAVDEWAASGPLTADDIYAGADEFGWFGGKIWRSVKRVAKKAAPVLKVAAGVAAVVVPAVGIPAAAALAAADRWGGDLERGVAGAKKALRATKKAARRGDPGAKRALAHLRHALDRRRERRVKAGPVTWRLADGRTITLSRRAK